MKIQPVSDLHLEFSDIQITNTAGADVLVLSGDIMLAEDLHDHKIGIDPDIFSYPDYQKLGERQEAALRYRNFLKRVSLEYSDVIYVAGNHEFYHGKWNASLDYLREECSRYSNIHFLECNTVKINNVTFVGGTLWTNLNKGDPLTQHAVRDLLNDFSLIRDDHNGYSKLRPSLTAVRHRKTLDYIQRVVWNVRDRNNPDEKVVVVGHHAPSPLSCHPNYANDYLMNGAYHSDLSEFILDHPEIVLWTHGHTHHKFVYTIGNCQIVCNPRGYNDGENGEYTGWDQNLIIEV